MFVSHSIWNVPTADAKTRKGRAPLPVIRQLAERLEIHRLRRGNPQTGLIFTTGTGNQLSLGNVVRRVILAALNHCDICKKPESNQRKANHKYNRDASIPERPGWHAARRGFGKQLVLLGSA